MKTMKPDRTIKQDDITTDTREERTKAERVLDEIKKKHSKMEFVKIPILNGYKLIEKSKYERLKHK